MKERRLVNHCISDNSYENPPSRKYPFIGARPGRGCRTAITARMRDLLQRRNRPVSGMRAIIATISRNKATKRRFTLPGTQAQKPRTGGTASNPGVGMGRTGDTCRAVRVIILGLMTGRETGPSAYPGLHPVEKHMSAAVNRVAVILPLQECEQRKDRSSRPCCCSGAENRP